MRVVDHCVGGIDDGPPREQNPPGPLLVLAHDDVFRKRVLVPDAPRNRRVDVREERCLEAQLLHPPEPLDTRLRPVEEIEEVALGRASGLVRELSTVDAGDVFVPTEGSHESGEPPIIGSVRILTGEHEHLASGNLHTDVARSSVVKLVRRDGVHPGPEPAGALGAAVARPGVDNDDLDLFVDTLAADRLQATHEICAAVLDRDDDGDHVRSESRRPAPPRSGIVSKARKNAPKMT